MPQPVPYDLLEGMTSISAFLERTDAQERLLEVLVDKTKTLSKAREIAFLQAKSKEFGVPLTMVEPEVIASLATGKTHGGILAKCKAIDLPPLTRDAIEKGGFYAYLDGIEDPYNLGYTLRSLYAFGACGVILPERNRMNAAGIVAKASAGVSEKLPIFISDMEGAIDLFQSAGYRVAAAGIRDAIEIDSADCSFPLLLVIGGEKRGISGRLLSKCDAVIKIPYARAFRGSLPTASAASVLAFEIFRKNRK